MGTGLALQHALFMLRQGLPPIVSVQLLGAVKLIGHLQQPCAQQFTTKTYRRQSCGQRACFHIAGDNTPQAKPDRNRQPYAPSFHLPFSPAMS